MAVESQKPEHALPQVYEMKKIIPCPLCNERIILKLQIEGFFDTSTEKYN